MGLWCNWRLLAIAKAHISDREEVEAYGILLSMSKETDESALNSNLCCKIAERFPKERLSAEMYVRSFCYGRIESALCASIKFDCFGKFALSKLWLDVGCRTKTFLTSTTSITTDKMRTWADFDTCYQTYRNDTRSKLREMRNSCGGCGGALSGERRKYCRCCRTYCYCDEECQKQHWENGHREECKEVEEHMRKILRAIRLGRFESLSPSASK